MHCQENKNPQIFIILLQGKNASTEQCQNDRSVLEGCIENIFYCEKNSSMLCAKGAIGNLMHIFHCPKNDMEQFWDIVQSHVHLILQMLGESFVPKAVLKSCGECDSIQECLWIFCKIIKFSTTSALRIKCFQDLQVAVNVLRMMKFPLIILVIGTHACYHHVVVIWRGMTIDYESRYTFPLTNDSLRQICGVNTTFHGISCGYGIFPPNHILNFIDNVYVEDWGMNENNIKCSSIRKYFK
jgi:hypothetical protein